MPDPLVVQVMKQFKLDLLAREWAQMQDMARQWLGLEDALESQMQAMADDLAREAAEGRAISQAKLWRSRRYQSLQAQLQRELASYTQYAEGLIAENQSQLGALGIQHATTATQVSMPGVGVYFDVLPIEAIENMVGLAGDGSPLSTLLRATWGDSAAGLTNELIRSTALGVNPRETARRMRQGATQGLNRMLNIARTEQLRVYREAGRQQYEFSGVVEGFKRLATHDDRVCPACLMAEGERYSVKQQLREHPSGRCTMVPIVKGMPEVQWEKGQDWFKRQDEATQIRILGRKRYDAWIGGKFDLNQLVSIRRNSTWGDSVFPTSLKDLLGKKPTPSRPIPQMERDYQTEVKDIRRAYQDALAAGNTDEAEGIKMYLDQIEKIHADERDINQALWDLHQTTPDQATQAQWQILSQNLQDEGYDLYKKYSKEGIELHVSEMRAAKFDGYADVGGKVVQVKRGRFSVREAQRIEGQMWEQAKKDLSEAYGKLLEQAGYKSSDIAKANFHQRARLLEELGDKELRQTKSGRISQIDDVDREVRERMVESVNYDLAARCDLAADDPLATPTLDAYRKMELSDIINSTILGGG